MCEKKGIYFTFCGHAWDWIEHCKDRCYKPRPDNDRPEKKACCSKTCCDEDIGAAQSNLTIARINYREAIARKSGARALNHWNDKCTNAEDALQFVKDRHEQCEARRLEEPRVLFEDSVGYDAEKRGPPYQVPVAQFTGRKLEID